MKHSYNFFKPIATNEDLSRPKVPFKGCTHYDGDEMVCDCKQNLTEVLTEKWHIK